MLYCKLSKTNLHVSKICLGTMTFGGQLDEKASAQLVHFCLDKGVNFFDTANVYGKGLSEEILGKILRSCRGKVVLATKVHGRMGDELDQEGLSSKAIVRAVEESLSRLQTDYLDLYYFHQPDYSVSIEESLEAADRLFREGKIRYLGISNYAAWQVSELLSAAQINKWIAPNISQPMYNLLARGIEQEYIPMAQELDVAMVVYNPLAGGLLTGKHNFKRYTPGTRFDGNKMYQNRYWNEANFHAISDLKSLAESHGCSLRSIALNWILHHTPVEAMILGASSLYQMEQNLVTCEEGPLSGEVLEGCDRIWKNLRGVTPSYNR